MAFELLWTLLLSVFLSSVSFTPLTLSLLANQRIQLTCSTMYELIELLVLYLTGTHGSHSSLFHCILFGLCMTFTFDICAKKAENNMLVVVVINNGYHLQSRPTNTIHPLFGDKYCCGTRIKTCLTLFCLFFLLLLFFLPFLHLLYREPKVLFSLYFATSNQKNIGLTVMN